MNNSNTTSSILGVTIHRYSIQKILEIIYSKIVKSSSTCHVLPIYTINPEFIVMSHELEGFKTILNRAFIAVPDGVGIRLAGLLKKIPVPARITGVDLVREFTNLAFEHDLSVGYLGGRHGSAGKSLASFTKHYPHLNGWAEHGPDITVDYDQLHKFDPNNISKTIKMDQNTSDFKSLMDKISKTDILFVAFGAPKQELFIEYLKEYIQSPDFPELSNYPNSKNLISVGVGGALDEISGVSARTPKWIQSIGFKWLFRLTTEPWRWRRQMRLFKFGKLLLTS